MDNIISPSDDLSSSSSKVIAITQQTCLVEEKFSKNGIQKNVHVVVKNNPFSLTLALLDKSLSFHQLSAEVQLVYDCPTFKEVDFVKLKPLEWKTRMNEEGDHLTIELRIKVLTSQLEDMFFRVRVKLIDPRTRKELPHLTTLTHPIRVVSKPDQVRKKIKKRKRAPTDNLMDTMHRLEAHQREQQKMLKRLCMFSVNDSTGEDYSALISSTFRSFSSSSTTTTGSSSSSTFNAPKDEFGTAFLDFLASFRTLQTQNPQDGYKINTCANDAQTMAEVLDLVRSEIRKSSVTSSTSSSATAADHDDGTSPCSCKVCPYKEKMDKINQSYKEYLYSAVLPDCQSLDDHSLAASSVSGGIIPASSALDLYADDSLLGTDADASLANFLNLGGVNGFGGFGNDLLNNYSSLEPIA